MKEAAFAEIKAQGLEPSEEVEPSEPRYTPPKAEEIESEEENDDYEVNLEDFGLSSNILTKRKLRYNEVVSLDKVDEEALSGYKEPERDMENQDESFKQLVLQDTSLERYYDKLAVERNKEYKAVISHVPELTLRSKRDIERVKISSEEGSNGFG